MTQTLIKGLHHVTAMASSPQKNVDFYAGVLGLRLVKKTINFDAPDVYHLYYGDETGSPGSILTFFPFHNIMPGRQGRGQAGVTSFSAPIASKDYWLERLQRFEVPQEASFERFGETVLPFTDWDGLKLELIFNDHDQRQPFTYGHIPLDDSIRGFYSVELWERTYERTESLLVDTMDHEFVGEEGPRRRYRTRDGHEGHLIDIVFDDQHDYGLGGSGTVHHIAFDTPNDDAQLAVREKVIQAQLMPTPVLDRQYFHSVYFREPGGVLFEIATTPPGFLYDEPVEQLGESLKLPPWEESRRAYIEKLLEPIVLNPERYA